MNNANKTRKLTHLQAQLAHLSANLSDLENLIGITSVQAEDMAFLGGYVASLYVPCSFLSLFFFFFKNKKKRCVFLLGGGKG